VPHLTHGCEIEFGGESLVLLPQRAVWWPSENTVLIADPHFGKAATFRAASIPIPDATESDLARLDQILALTKASRLIVLGDLLHARQGRCRTTFESVTNWRRRHRDLSFQLIRGNHDHSAGHAPAEWEIDLLSDPAPVGPFDLRHYPMSGLRPTIAGHLHPKLRLQAQGDRLKLSCYLLRGSILVLPAFTEFVDSGEVRLELGDAAFVIADDEVFRTAPG
jgi:DNA ligase-associated metallophosphoesterase